jgi:hypothetical protein
MRVWKLETGEVSVSKLCNKGETRLSQISAAHRDGSPNLLRTGHMSGSEGGRARRLAEPQRKLHFPVSSFKSHMPIRSALAPALRCGSDYGDG